MKNQILRMVVVLMAGFLSAGARAEKVGNGGNAVVCYGETGLVESVTMFDYWERDAEAPEPTLIRLGGPELSVREKVELVLRRLSRFDPTRADQYRSFADDIFEHLDQYFVDGMSAKAPIRDSNDRRTPDLPCRKVQFAIQYIGPSSWVPEFKINRELYFAPATSNDARAGLILHEVIYREAIAFGYGLSDRVRFFNFYLATDQIENATIFEYEHALKKAGLTYLDDCRPFFPAFRPSGPGVEPFVFWMGDHVPQPGGTYPSCGTYLVPTSVGEFTVTPASVFYFDDHAALTEIRGVDWRTPDGRSKKGNVRIDGGLVQPPESALACAR